MPPIEAPLVAVLAQSHAGVLPVLFDVVGVTRWGRITHRARKLFDKPHVRSFLRREGVVHKVAFSTWRLEASIERHTAILS